MPIIRVEWWQGRTKETKKVIAKEITDLMVSKAGCPASAVTVIFDDYDKENWAIAGEISSEKK